MALWSACPLLKAKCARASPASAPIAQSWPHFVPSGSTGSGNTTGRVSFQTSINCPGGLVIFTDPDGHVVPPTGIPEQYWVVALSHGLPPMPLKNAVI